MKIKAHLATNALILIGLTIILIILAGISMKSSVQATQSEAVGVALAQDITDLLFLLDDYEDYQYPRIEQQLQAKFNTVRQLITNEIRSNEEMQTDLELLENQFSQIRLIQDNTALHQEISKNHAFRLRLSSHMNLTGQKILSLAFQLISISQENILSIQRRSRRVILGYVVLMLIIIVFQTFSTYRKINRPLKKLIEGALRIKEGDLTYTFDKSHRKSIIDFADEIGFLAMTYNDIIRKQVSSLDSLLLEVTERKKIERELSNERNLLKAIIGNIPVMITRFDPDTNVTYLNKEFEETVGWTTDEIQSINLMEEVYPDSVYRKYAMEYMLEAGNEWREFDIRSKSGKTIQSEWSNILLDNGTRIGIGIDISRRVLADEQFRQSQKMESVGRLAGGIAHDFNNMLGVILGYAELGLKEIERDPSSTDSLVSSLQEIHKTAERSSALTRQLLAFARKQSIVPRVLNLNDIIYNMLNMLRSLIGENIDLTWLPTSGMWSVKLDPSQIDQVLANLCVNARDAIKDVGRIIIETREVSFDESYCRDHRGFIPGDFVQLSVSDDGCGMDKETLGNVFEPFFTTKKSGTGLGLSTVYGIVKQNEGFINVYSEPGDGTTFKIYLPRHKGKAEQVPVDGEAELVVGGDETILLVEDELSLLKLTGIMLISQGYTVLSASTPDEAIRLAGENTDRINLLITDVVMPGMNGRDLAKNLQMLRGDMKCLFMSGYTADIIAHRGVLDEGVSFIQKPFAIQDLATKVREVLNGK